MNNVLYKAFPAGLTDFIVVSAIVIFAAEFNMTTAEVSTSSTLLMSIVGFMILYRISKPMNPYRSVLFCVMITGFILCSIYMSSLFNIHDISTKTTMLLVVFAVACESVFRYTTILVNKMRIFYYFSVRKLTRLKHKYFDD